MKRTSFVSITTLSLVLAVGCADDTATDVGQDTGETATSGDGDGDGDGDGMEGMTTDMGDGDGDPATTGDGDGDPSGDGDGDPSGDGDGDPSGDGDGDPSGDGDGDPSGDGDGDTAETTDTDTMGTTATTGNNNCEAPADYVDCDGVPGMLTNNPFEAIGINCPGGDATNSIQAANAVMNSSNNNAWRVAAQFGTADGPNYNGKLWAANTMDWVSPNDDSISPNTSTAILILSTGLVAQANGQGVVTEANGSQDGNGENGNQDGGGLPAPLSANRGSNNGLGGTPFMDCDLVNDCSDSLHQHWNVNGWNNPNDKLWMQMDLTVPAETEGYIFDFAYFSSEFPTYYNTQYNDLFIAWSTSESYTGNITFVNDAPLTITSLENANAFQYKANAPQLAGTGFEGHAGTGWFVARGSATPGEVFQLTFFIADMADSILATGVLLDNFRWECEGCIPSEVNSCGIQPQ
ncbi:Endo-1,4-beta-xylanase A precursor [Enhygromyxa salina]|uniref:Endo-1,4-beta-xylanase A n=1 Tax=Enhygromyxa salina TaxID=215803 RepID=A0A0C2DH28_9BACT|nr:choice-of-anchor L domain-containing protein [Enhygromyxa salina]KIG18982.1 Endo-1,4-beta-xylanase A precursor [Enhygromyxa salina]